MTAARASLRWRMTALTAVAVGAVLLLTALAAASRLHAALEAEWRRDLTDRRDALLTWFATLPREQWAEAPYLEAYSGHYWQLGSDAAATPDPLHAQSPSLQGYDLLGEATDRIEAGFSRRLDGPLEEPLLSLITAAAVVDGRPRSLIVARDASELDALLASMDRALALGFAVAWLAAVLIAAAAATIGTRPLSRLAREVRALTRGERDRVSEDVASELAPLARQLNDLIALHRRRLERQRMSAANLAHELRTPLTALQQQAERGETVDAEFVRERIRRMRPLIDHELARARIHGPAPGLEPCAVAEQVQRAVELCRIDHGLEAAAFQLDLAPDLHWRLEARDLFTVVWNLLDNAARHGGPPLRLRAGNDAHGMPWLSVEDGGRQSAGRSEDAQGGAGMHLVEIILEAYKLELEISTSELGGRRAVVTTRGA